MIKKLLARFKPGTAMQSSNSVFPEERGGVNFLLRSLQQRFFNKSNSKVIVSSENAYQLSAYWLAVSAISADIAKLPVRAYTKQGEEKKPIANNPLQNVLTRGFNDEMDSMTGIQLWIQWCLTFGNSYTEIVRNDRGEMQFFPIHPSRVTPYRPSGGGPLDYYVSFGDQVDQQKKGPTSTTIKNKDMLHFRGLGNEAVGMSIGEVAAQSLGIAMAAQNFTGSFFGNDLALGAVLETDKALNNDQKNAIRKDWVKKFAGSDNAFKLGVLDRGFKFSNMQMKSTDAELLNTRKFQVVEIARWFRIPPHKLMDLSQAKFANLEQNDLNYITDTLTPWIKRLEVQLKFKFHRNDNTYIDFDEKGLARGDMAARTAYYNSLQMMGAINADTIANLEGIPKPDQGEVYYMPLNMAPVGLTIERQQLDNEQKKKDIETPEPQPEPEPPKEPEPEPEPEKEEPEEKQADPSESLTEQTAIAAYLPVMADSLSRLTRKEILSHESAGKKEPVAMKEHLDKFYIKFEQELADCFQIHADFICNIQSKEKFTSDKLMFMSKEVCQLEKLSNQSDVVLEYLLKEIAQLEEAPKLGEIRQDDDGNKFMFNMSGWVSVDVTKK